VDIAAWLRGLGLEQYEAAFRANDIDASVLPRLTSDDLKDLGVASVGHRRRLLDAIGALGPEPTTVAVVPVHAAAERRQLTVMFCDLVGSTALSTRLDPEDLSEVVGAYHRAVAGVVENFDGFIAKYMGDGVLAYFGYPRAHEDDAERAIRAGLGAIDAVRRLEVRSGGLQTRVGIATGLVVVGDQIGEGSAREQSVIGETPNLAARLQTLAEPNTLIIALGTRRLVGDLFEYRNLDAVELKGIPGPTSAYQVLRPTVIESRFEALRGSTLTQLIGRDDEIDLLMRRWARSKTGDGQVVLISGEPGIGKSRMIAALEERISAVPPLRLRYFCSPYHQDSALYPFINQLTRAARLARDDPLAVKLEKIVSLLAGVGLQTEDIALFSDLLSLQAAERYPVPDLGAQLKKKRTLEALIRYIGGLSRQPVVMVCEDVHWIDPTSRELLDLIVERVRYLPVLLIITFRPEFQPPWTGQQRVTILALNRLDRADLTVMANQIAGGKALPSEIIDQILNRSDGIPLFIEEWTKSILERGLLREEAHRYVLDSALPSFAIPMTLHDSLMARLDAHISGRYVAQTGAAIGREFSYALLRAVSDLPEEVLQTALSRLVASEVMFRRGTPPDAVYAFKHALLQDAAHSSLLRVARQRLHRRIAETLEAQFPELKDGQPELLAQHYAEAGLFETSIGYWLGAGRQAVARSTMAEAIASLHKGLNLLSSLPDSDSRREQELDLQIVLRSAIIAMRGYAAPELAAVNIRARELCEQLESQSRFLDVLGGQWVFHLLRGELDQAEHHAAEMRSLAGAGKGAVEEFWASARSGEVRFYLGRFIEARPYFEKAISLYNPTLFPKNAGIGTQNSSTAALIHLSRTLLCLGYLDRARLPQADAIAEAACSSPHDKVFTLSNSWYIDWVIEGIAAASMRLKLADEILAISSRHGFLLWSLVSNMLRSWSLAMLDQSADNILSFAQSLTEWRATGCALNGPFFLSLLAEAYAKAGQVQEGLEKLWEAVRLIETTQEHWFEPEVYRMRGILFSSMEDFEAAEQNYQLALGAARRQDAKLWELRAAVNFARLRRDQGRHTEARDLLAPVYGWFTDGFATPDLKGAKTLVRQEAGEIQPAKVRPR
jgi:class 3 adenylate cyclase/predicted ATPase